MLTGPSDSVKTCADCYVRPAAEIVTRLKSSSCKIVTSTLNMVLRAFWLVYRWIYPHSGWSLIGRSPRTADTQRGAVS